MSDEEPSAIGLAELHDFFATLEMDRPPLIVEGLARDRVWGRIAIADIKTRPGGYVPGPSMMGACDLIAWVLVFTRIGITPMALTWDLKINFLRPAHGADVIVDARQTKFGRLSHASIDLFLEGDRERLVAHATTTYVVPDL